MATQKTRPVYSPKDPSQYTREEKDELAQLGLEHHWIQNHQQNDLVAPGAFRIMVKGEGHYVYDIEGNKYIDAMAGLFLMALGHGQDEIVDAAAQQMKTLAYANSGAYSNVPAIELATKVASLAPGDMSRVFFCGGGAEAVDIALKMARQYQYQAGNLKKVKIIARRGQYHGSTYATMSLTGRAQYRGIFEPLMPNVLHVEMPYCYRCPFGHERTNGCCMLPVKSLQNLIDFEGADTIAAFIATPFPGANQIPPDEYWPEVVEILKKNNILLIADEIICGFGRTGKWFGMENWDVKPDIMTVAKALTSGYLPVGAVVATKEVADRFLGEYKDAFHHGVTYGSHPGVMAAALKNLEIMERLNVVDNSAEMGQYLYDKAVSVLYENHPTVGYVGGGKGLLMGIEIVKDRKTKEKFGGGPRSEFGNKFSEKLRSYGLATRGGDNITLSPPLTVDKALIDEIVNILDIAIGEMEDEYLPK